MARLLTILAIAIAVFTPSTGAVAANSLKRVEAQYVCMINNKFLDKPQIPVTVGGKTYYGCCPMCKAKLEKSAAARTAVDPVSGKQVDKASAVIGAAPDGTVHYFESEANLSAFSE
jgi:YHS domain-containing protein